MADLIDLTGQKFGYYTVLRKGDGRKSKGGAYKATWICRCDCGNIREVDGEKLRHRPTISCGCMRYATISEKKRDDCIGQKYERLTVIRYLEKDERKLKTYNYLCKCDCGNYVHANISKLKSGHTRSCGCLEKEVIGSLNKKYEHSNRRLYGIFRAMHNRCENIKNPRYNGYGGRGICVCDEWSTDGNGFDRFYEWSMAHGYQEDLTIDRIDNDKGYSPDNCRWITNKKQQNNRKNNRYITFNEETHSLTEWAEILNISRSKLTWHLNNGRTIQDVIDNYLD